MTRWCALAMLLAVSCSSPPVVIVHFDADETLRADATSVQVIVRDAGGAQTYMLTHARTDITWPFTLPVRVSGAGFSIEGTLTRSAGVVRVAASVAAPTGDGGVWLRFTADCAIDCAAARRACIGGACADACYVASPSPSAPISCGGVDAGMDAAPIVDAGTDVGPDAGSCDCPGDTRVGGLCTPPAAQLSDLAQLWYHFACASGPQGTWCWGRNVEGQGGEGSAAASIPPTALGAIGRVRLNGPTHACALGSGSARRCWGDNATGQYGDGTHTTSRTPALVADTTHTWSTLASGYDFTCGVETPSRHAWCWGTNSAGELARVGAASATPLQIMDSGGLPIVAYELDVGVNYVLTVVGSRTVGWGAAANGQLGEGVSGNVLVPRMIAVPGDPQIAHVAAGQTSSCAITTGGALYCWGQAGLRLGRDAADTSPSARPAAVAHPNGTSWTSVSVGGDHACAIDALGHAWCWGSNTAFQLGIGPMAGTPTPQQVHPDSGPDQPWSSISAGVGGTCGTTSAGAVYCWGSNDEGVLGTTGDIGAHIQTPRRVCLPAGS